MPNTSGREVRIHDRVVAIECRSIAVAQKDRRPIGKGVLDDLAASGMKLSAK
jgi:hypothetical protein